MREIEAEHFSHSYSHIGIAGKIKVDLEAKGYYSYPCGERRERRVVKSLYFRPELAYRVCQKHLFRKPCYKQGHPVGQVSHADPSVLELRRDIPVLDNRSRHNLRKAGDIRREIDKALLDGYLSAVEIDSIGHALECEKGYSYRQRQTRIGYPRSEDRIKYPYREGAILKDKQQPQIHHYRYYQAGKTLFAALGPCHQSASGVIYQGGYQHDPDIDRLAPGVKQNARDKQKRVFKLFGGYQINQQHRRKVVKQKFKTCKNHPFTCPLSYTVPDLIFSIVLLYSS